MTGPQAGPSGACQDDTLPRLHAVCPGSFIAHAGDVEHSAPRGRGCPCHRPGIDLHQQAHRKPST